MANSLYYKELELYSDTKIARFFIKVKRILLPLFNNNGFVIKVKSIASGKKWLNKRYSLYQKREIISN